MFDWDGEELANIIWGKTGDNEDHIVPYPDETYEKSPDFPRSNATKLDLEHTDKKAQIDNGSQNFHNQSEDVDYGWANVESFNDLDTILSNNDLVYENTNILSIESPSLQLNCEHKLGFIKDENTNLEKMECNEGKNEKSASNIVRRIPIRGGIGIGVGIGIGKARNQETYKHFNNGYKITGDKKPLDSSSLTPLRMTPQEKIEKLRKRQQMRALLAIHKQQQEFRNQSSCNNNSNESQIDESLSTFMMNTSSLEDTVLHQLQNVIATLGVEIRLCIRDSLFRLAQSALKRQCDTVNSTKERLASTKSSATTSEGETKTNPIDRAVAHLLFHRPPELSSSGNLQG